MPPPVKVVFASGDHVFANGTGRVSVHVPRDVTLDDLMPMISALAREGGLDARKRESAPSRGKQARNRV